MKKFKIKKSYTYFLDCEIEAETREEAINKSFEIEFEQEDLIYDQQKLIECEEIIFKTFLVIRKETFGVHIEARDEKEALLIAKETKSLRDYDNFTGNLVYSVSEEI